MLSSHAFIPNTLFVTQFKKFPIQTKSRKLDSLQLTCSGIVLNTKSGGHAFVGYYLSRSLQKQGVKVTLWNEGFEEELQRSQPFSYYPELQSLGADILFSNSAIDTLKDRVKNCDWIVDNFSKSVETAKPLVELAMQVGVRQYLFISSAGIYKASSMIPHLEDDPINSHSPISETEQFLLSQNSFAATCFRPIYLVGLKSAKTSYTDYFFDRIVRGQKVPIPYPGEQLVSLSHVEDLVRMIILSIDNSKAFQQIFNATSGKFITFEALAKLCSQVCSKPLHMFCYDADLSSETFSLFPFRNRHFTADPRKAQQLLNWNSSTNLAENIAEMFAEYLSQQKDKRNISFHEDQQLKEIQRV